MDGIKSPVRDWRCYITRSVHLVRRESDVAIALSCHSFLARSSCERLHIAHYGFAKPHLSMLFPACMSR